MARLNVVRCMLKYLPPRTRRTPGTQWKTTGWSREVIIAYKYDPLSRLRQAGYNNGRQFDYTYDAVGNILTKTVDPGPGSPVMTTYQYDTANRLTHANAQLYTWDYNGNLLNDGIITFTYNHANQLASVSGSGITATSYSYNGLGDRLRQTNMLGSVEYTLDLAGGLTQVLSDGAHFFLYGNGRIGEELFNSWQYHLSDGLGSVRQLTDQSSVVTLAKGYEPYGEVLDSAGSASSAYGYTGEWTDNIGLVYLRARYYDPTIARFITKDPSQLEQNLFQYANANPIINTDPTGLMSGLEAFAMCFAIHTSSKSGLPIRLDDISAQYAVDVCKLAYSKDAWASWPFGKTLTTAHALFGYYVNELGDTSHLVFNASEPLTKELSRSNSMKNLRLQFLQSGQTLSPKELRFGRWEQFACLTDGYHLLTNLTCFMGGFYYQIKEVNTTTGTYVGFRIDNRTDLGSGTHIAFRYEDVFSGGSVEDLILSDQITGNESIADVMMSRGVVSILSPLHRAETGWYTSSLGTHELGGGSLTQTYVWMEKFDRCDPLSFLRFLLSWRPEIEEWYNYYPPNTQPILRWEEPF